MSSKQPPKPGQRGYPGKARQRRNAEMLADRSHVPATNDVPEWIEVRIIGVDTPVQNPGEQPGDVLVGGGPNRHWRLIHTSLTGNLGDDGGDPDDKKELP